MVSITVVSVQISIFYKEGIGVKFHSSSHNATFSYIVNTLTNLN